MPQATQTRRITISVDTNGSQELKNIASQLGEMSQSAKGLADGFGWLTQGALGFLGALSVRELASFSDQIEELNNRLLAVTGNQDDATHIMAQLAQTARDTNGSLQGTVEVYAKIALALKAANISSDTTLEFTKALTNTFRLSGKSAEDAAAGVSSLAYGFQLGEIRGRELRTVLRDNSVLANILRKEFGGNLLSAANDGFITTASLMKIVLAHMEEINASAKNLNVTFGQTVTKAVDAFKLKIFELNDALGASSGFGAAMSGVIKNMGSIITLFTILAVTTMPILIAKTGELAVKFAAMNPIVAIIEAITVGLIALDVHFFGNSTDITDLISQMHVGFLRLEANIDDFIAKFAELNVAFAKFTHSGAAEGWQKIADKNRIASAALRDYAQEVENANDRQKKLAELNQANATDAARRAADIAKAADKLAPDRTAAQLLAELNRQYREGAISISEYNTQLQDTKIKIAQVGFRDGKIDLEKLNEAFDAKHIFDYNEALKDGVVTYQKYDDSIRNVNQDKLNRELQAGKISLEQYNAQLASVSNNFSVSGAFRTGLQDYVTSIGTSTQQVAKLITTTFGNVETALFTFIKTGKFNFDQFTQSVLDDLLKIIIRMSIVQPLAQGLLGLATAPAAAKTLPASNTSFDNVAAHGATFDGRVAKFATGGIVSGPTSFGYGNGQSGLMGEAGPEAIIPLTRASNGDLGVKASITPVTVNIINQSGNDVQQSQSTGPNGEQQLDVLITSKVRQGLSSGKYDTVMKSTYGLGRRGT